MSKKSKKFSFGDCMFVCAILIPGLTFGIIGFSWHAFAITTIALGSLVIGALIAIFYR